MNNFSCILHILRKITKGVVELRFSPSKGCKNELIVRKYSKSDFHKVTLFFEKKKTSTETLTEDFKPVV